MSFPPGFGATVLDAELEELRKTWSARSHHDTIQELQNLTRSLRKAEGEAAEEKRKSEAAKREFYRLKEVEKAYRAEVAEKKYTNKIADINANLRRHAVQGTPAEDVIERLHQELEDKDTAVNILQEEVDQLRRLQKQVLNAAGSGLAGELLAARQHSEYLSRRVEKLTDLNHTLHNDTMQLFRRLQTNTAPLKSNISRYLCSSCKPKTVVWYDDIMTAWKELYSQLEEARHTIHHLVSSLSLSGTQQQYAAPHTPQQQLQHPNGNPPSSRKWSPSQRNNPPVPTTPIGMRSMQM
eukprot:TRINITY_DN22549_c0_g1_i1.p2 TRINITY_DN22549_c0_g1~~TRINITY_DN22549_c0_g1_i1.p2  ORF type:complete len:295 (+),score=88.94 TRINITY_DN22549_c0_g1_i1:1051-1935(+)